MVRRGRIISSEQAVAWFMVAFNCSVQRLNFVGAKAAQVALGYELAGACVCVCSLCNAHDVILRVVSVHLDVLNC